MIRLIKRYGSRKLYDTEESRYASLDEIAGWVNREMRVQIETIARREPGVSWTVALSPRTPRDLLDDLRTLNFTNVEIVPFDCIPEWEDGAG